MIDRIKKEVSALGKTLTEAAVTSIKENEKSIARAAENYDMSITVSEDGACVIEFSRDSAVVTTYQAVFFR